MECLDLRFAVWGQTQPFRLLNRLVHYAKANNRLSQRAGPMTITVDATYENGVLKPKQPLALTEGTEVRLAISPLDEDFDPLDAVLGIGDGPSDAADNHDKYIYGRPLS